jgi:hypothetical protein
VTHRRNPPRPSQPPARHPDYAELKLRPTEERLLRVLCDGLRHTKRELAATCLDDGVQYGDSALRRHICTLRDKLRPLGQGILCLVVWHYRYYQLVRFINPEAAYETAKTPDALGPASAAPGPRAGGTAVPGTSNGATGSVKPAGTGRPRRE